MHARSLVKRREPTILKLTNTYNDLCRQLTGLIASGRAPLGSAAPRPIQRDGLFKLNVDDDIWQDVSLNDGFDGGVPQWLGDEEVCSGIQDLLQYDWCCEEELRLRKEHCNLQQWFMEEWDGIRAARGACGERSLVPCPKATNLNNSSQP